MTTGTPSRSWPAEKRHSEALRQANEQWQLRMDEALEAQERLMSEIGRIETKAKVIYEQIPVHISPEKSVYCAPTADTIRLLEHARATGSMPSASAIVDAERATPSDFSYTDFVLSYAELAVRYNRLRARNNQLIDWVASNGRPDSADTD